MSTSEIQQRCGKTTPLPGHTPFMLNLANNLIYHGSTDEAEALLRQIIDIQPNSPQAHWSLAGVHRASNDSHTRQMRERFFATCQSDSRNTA